MGEFFVPDAVLFDCDGVLADSEHLVNSVVAEDLTSRGWPLSPEAARETFLGMAITDMIPVIEDHVGKLPEGWHRQLHDRIVARYAAELKAVPGALEAVSLLRAAGVPMAVASNSSRSELRRKIERLGFAGAFGERVFSYQDVARPKPHPDIYLAAAASCGADPSRCVVVEDSVAGVRAGVAAGCRVLGFSRETPVLDLLEAGAAETFADYSALPGLLGLGVEARG